MSLTNPNKVVTEERLSDFYQSILPYLGGMPDVCGGGFAPIGTIIAFMGTTAPQDYLACDGTVYNIADYPRLAQFFTDQFGSANKFGGNGTTTFAVPDLKGEFLRGAGTNSHTNQGNGSNVGTHQDGTVIPNIAVQNNTTTIYDTDSTSDWHNLIANWDNSQKNVARTNLTGTREITSGSNVNGKGTVRPTNTSILWCIKAVEPGEVYSTSERIVGTWIDGKPLYQKTLTKNFAGVEGRTRQWVTLFALNELPANIDTCCSIKGYYDKYMFPLINATSDVIGFDSNLYYGSAGIQVLHYGNTWLNEAHTLTLTIQYTKTTD